MNAMCLLTRMSVSRGICRYRRVLDEVRIRRHGSGVILEPIVQDCAWLDELIGPIDESFELAVAEKPGPSSVLAWISLNEIPPRR